MKTYIYYYKEDGKTFSTREGALEKGRIMGMTLVSELIGEANTIDRKIKWIS
jgi:hypothetical protein